MSIVDVMDRPLPSFKQWIEEHSPGTQADGFAGLADLAYRSQVTVDPNLSPSAQAFARMWMGGCVAAVELCNMESVKHGTPEADIIALLPRVFAAASMYAIASACKETTPWRDVAKIVTEEFRAAAKKTADALSEQYPRS